METTADHFLRLAGEVASATKISFPLAELDDLLTAAHGEEIAALPVPCITDPYRLNYVTTMVEMAAHRAQAVPPLWTSTVAPLKTPVFVDPSLNLRAHLLTASPPPFRRRNIFIDSSIGDRI